jgi:hypothetical protein
MADKKKPAPGQDEGPAPLSPEQVLWDKVYYNEFTTVNIKYQDLQDPEARAIKSAEVANVFLATRDKLCNVDQFEEEPKAGS